MSNSQKLIEWTDRKIEGYSRPENHYEPIQHNEDLYSFHTTAGYKFYSSSHRELWIFAVFYQDIWGRREVLLSNGDSK